MLNYIWIGLILVGVLAAAGNDLRDEAKNPYRNGVPLECTLEVMKTPNAMHATWDGVLVIPPRAFKDFYGVQDTREEIHQPVSISTATSGASFLTLPVDENSPALWREMAKSAANRERLTGTVHGLRFSPDGRSAILQFTLEPIRFVKLKAITQATLEYASTAVTISLGLIGIMALWLGVMKVAEAAGLLAVLTRALAPLTRRLFPDVPQDHPAVGAMIMNIAANVLGLSNAATPLGLKAMEELNKLSPRAGTATNAMCTFLAINTAGFVVLPATAIAVRAAVGSSNPGMIIGTTIVGGLCATIAGVTSAKVLQRLPRYRRALEADHG